MPALNPVPKVVRVTLRHQTTDGDNDVINRFFVQYSGTAPTDGELNTFAASVGTAWATNIAPICVTNLHLIEVNCEDLTSNTSAVGLDAEDIAGTITNPPLSMGVATVVSFAISRRYRGGHPRIYGPWGGADDLSSQDAWSSDYIAAVLAAWEAFMDTVETAGWSGAGTLLHVNVSYFHGFTNHTFPSGRVRPIPTPLADPLVDEITGYTVNPRPASQRRRNLQGS